MPTEKPQGNFNAILLNGSLAVGRAGVDPFV